MPNTYRDSKKLWVLISLILQLNIYALTQVYPFFLLYFRSLFSAKKTASPSSLPSSYCNSTVVRLSSCMWIDTEKQGSCCTTIYIRYSIEHKYTVLHYDTSRKYLLKLFYNSLLLFLKVFNIKNNIIKNVVTKKGLLNYFYSNLVRVKCINTGF